MDRILTYSSSLFADTEIGTLDFIWGPDFGRQAQDLVGIADRLVITTTEDVEYYDVISLAYLAPYADYDGIPGEKVYLNLVLPSASGQQSNYASPEDIELLVSHGARYLCAIPPKVGTSLMSILPELTVEEFERRAYESDYMNILARDVAVSLVANSLSGQITKVDELELAPEKSPAFHYWLMQARYMLAVSLTCSVSDDIPNEIVEYYERQVGDPSRFNMIRGIWAHKRLFMFSETKLQSLVLADKLTRVLCSEIETVEHFIKYHREQRTGGYDDDMLPPYITLSPDMMGQVPIDGGTFDPFSFEGFSDTVSIIEELGGLGDVSRSFSPEERDEVVTAVLASYDSFNDCFADTLWEDAVDIVNRGMDKLTKMGFGNEPPREENASQQELESIYEIISPREVPEDSNIEQVELVVPARMEKLPMGFATMLSCLDGENVHLHRGLSVKHIIKIILSNPGEYTLCVTEKADCVSLATLSMLTSTRNRKVIAVTCLPDDNRCELVGVFPQVEGITYRTFTRDEINYVLASGVDFLVDTSQRQGRFDRDPRVSMNGFSEMIAGAKIPDAIVSYELMSSIVELCRSLPSEHLEDVFGEGLDSGVAKVIDLLRISCPWLPESDLNQYLLVPYDDKSMFVYDLLYSMSRDSRVKRIINNAHEIRKDEINMWCAPLVALRDTMENADMTGIENYDDLAAYCRQEETRQQVRRYIELEFNVRLPEGDAVDIDEDA